MPKVKLLILRNLRRAALSDCDVLLQHVDSEMKQNVSREYQARLSSLMRRHRVARLIPSALAASARFH